ncbi:hypothetical protein BB560_003981 [Smittium megazygosporum]|uniref:LYC1 C-terminal domain-containing protein n=1 Tax=Smittium megazygosporum TaxID=133381 RepID=A0A2T9ZAK9_9FUNG|nr:hypothetical protein BB560_003981 [Smittium megazygosporum]
MVASKDTNINEYGLFEAITPEQITKTWTGSYDEWGKQIMDIQTYVKRESVLASRPFTSENITSWILCKKEEHEKNPETLNFVCHCETFSRKALVRLANEKKVQDINCHSIASVFCPHENRGRGYAVKMMTELFEILSKRTQLTTLYSDVGEIFYSRLGWKVYPLVAAEVSTAGNPVSSSDTPSVSFMNRELVEKLMNLDGTVVRRELENFPVSEKTQFAILPCFEPIDWRWARDEFEGKSCLGIPEFPTVFGAFLPTSLVNEDTLFQNDNSLFSQEENLVPPSFVVWTPRYRENSIAVLRARFNSADDVEPLIKAALSEAKRLNLPKVVLWNIEDRVKSVFETKFKTSFVKKKDSLPSAALFVPGGDAEAEWILNENYPWV